MAEMNLASWLTSNQAIIRHILYAAYFLGINMEDTSPSFSRQPIHFCTNSLPIYSTCPTIVAITASLSHT